MKYLILTIATILCYVLLHEWKYQDFKNRSLSIIVCAVIIINSYYMILEI